MFGRLKNEKGKGSVIWFFCIVIFTLTWLASFLVKKTLETTLLSIDESDLIKTTDMPALTFPRLIFPNAYTPL